MKGHFVKIILSTVFVFFADLSTAQLETKGNNYLYLYANTNRFDFTQVQSPIAIGSAYKSLPVFHERHFVQKTVLQPNFILDGKNYVNNTDLKYVCDQNFEAFILEKNRKPIAKFLNGILQKNISGSFISGKEDMPISSRFFVNSSLDFVPNNLISRQLSSKNIFNSGKYNFFNENSAMFFKGEFIYGDKYGNSKDSYRSGSRYFSVNDKSFRYMDTIVDYDQWYDYYFLLWLMDVMYELNINK
jgi:hypothetical protein